MQIAINATISIWVFEIEVEWEAFEIACKSPLYWRNAHTSDLNMQ